ncbi:hypothetical protein PGT21_011202 [Puccinia graminis f. sp. tritici]|uniref:Uncharacterized protein n=1 Tax=Puccinia graminis f. sp. tritici TaxID=56615 RepID=A0A5B0P036_PUCGR|nr:hypothetical protein PGTUg99_032427 [Puccinia graminis f. sp. tritici]KAA1094114.1 hypothetical protein PGT21_010107 [Puccinia graminis f. sp. tritici]KAA1108395.1 hypothetical protein PGT21_011202 [Puccinia graminis f. sp. tritici]
MQIWKILIFCLPRLLLGSGRVAHHDLRFDFFHKDHCETGRAEVKNLQQETCPNANCRDKYYQRMEAYCPDCKARDHIDVPGCSKHGGSVDFTNHKN